MKNRVNKILLIWAIVVSVALVALGVFEVVRIAGHSKLQSKNAITAPVTTSTEVLTESENELQWQDDWVSIMVLFMIITRI